jgi:3',5'-cyclic AMP phosphodiesterase CpdA
MRTLIHLSDLHFDRIDPALIAPLIALVNKSAPDLSVISGDLTQRARTEQFKAARRFLDALPMPQIIVPGNHDIPLHDILGRFTRPLKKYRRYITDDLEPAYVDEEIAVLGINTARSLSVKNGRINQEQLERLRARICALGDHVTKIIVTHHPFDLPDRYGDSNLVGRASMAMQMFASLKVDLLLAGHLHASHAGNISERYEFSGYSALAVQAGTATSTRGRGESNSFNLIRIDSPRIVVERFTWVPDSEEFTCTSNEAFERTSNGWTGLKLELLAR